MIGALLAPLLVAAAVDPCAPVAPAAAPDAEVAALYRRVGEAERAAGAAETAAVAYRAALALAPADGASRQALLELCQEGARSTAPGAFEEGLARLEAGDLRAAITAFQRARADRPDPSAALLEGICRYRLGEDGQAVPLLRQAEAAPLHRDAARLYLGLVALRRGEAGQAAGYLDGVAESSDFGRFAPELARMARRSGPLVLSVQAESGWDSNVGLAPHDALVSGDGAGMWSITTSALYRPMGESGPYLRGTAAYRDQLRFSSLDLGALSGAGGWQLGRAGQALLAEYAYDHRVLDGNPYLSAHRLLASGWTTFDEVVLSATGFVRLEDYRGADYAPFSGRWGQGELRGSWPLGGLARLGLGYRLGADLVRQDPLSWVEHGPRADLRAVVGRVRLDLEVGVVWRRYDATDPLLGARRSDRDLDLGARAEVDLGARWTAWLSADARKASSNLPAFTYLKVVPAVGLAYVMGL